VRYADPVAQAEIDRLRAGEDASEPGAEGWTAGQVWHYLLESSVMRRHYLLEKFLQAQDDANRCFLEGHVMPDGQPE
jgi:hypothetical protein